MNQGTDEKEREDAYLQKQEALLLRVSEELRVEREKNAVLEKRVADLAAYAETLSPS